MGSGCLAAMAVIETGFKEEMSEEEATALVTKAIEAGIYHDLGSGSNVDLCIIKKGKTTLTRSVKSDNKKVFSKPYLFLKNSFAQSQTSIISSTFFPFELIDNKFAEAWQ